MVEHNSGKALALFGIGRVGQIRLHDLTKSKGFILKYIVDLSKDIIRHVTKDLDLSFSALEFNEKNKVFEDEDIVAILICTPTSSHEDLIIRGLNAGKHIFCEKPLTLSYLSTKKCCDLAREKGLILHCSFQRRFDPSFREVFDRMNAGETGTVTSIKSLSRDPEPPSEKIMREAGCSMFFDSAVHDIDMVCWFAKQWPTSVYAIGHGWSNLCKELSDIDVIHALLKFPSGAIGAIEVNRYSPVGYDQRFEVSGTSGMLQVTNRRCNQVKSYTKHGSKASQYMLFFQERYAESFKMSTDYFLKALEGGENEINEEVILNVIKVVVSCEESWRTGRPVEFEPDVLSH